jgi:cysteinyl-tRNA synthetase
MAKSGEFLKLDLLAERGYDVLAYRYMCLTAHYRQQLVFTWEALDGAQNALKNLKGHVGEIREFAEEETAYRKRNVNPQEEPAPLPEYLSAFREACENDLNMPQALAVVWKLLRGKGEFRSPGAVYRTLLEMDSVLGLGMDKMEREVLEISEEEIEKAIADRDAARKARDFLQGDIIRSNLLQHGIVLEDGSGGTTWRRA